VYWAPGSALFGDGALFGQRRFGEAGNGESQREQENGRQQLHYEYPGAGLGGNALRWRQVITLGIVNVWFLRKKY